MNFEALKTTPISSFCLTQLGYKVDRQHDSRSWRALTSPHGEKIITKTTPNANGHYLFKATTSDVSGTLVDLLLKVEQKTWSEIHAFFSHSIYISKKEKVVYAPSQKPVFLSPGAILDKIRTLHTPNNNYLTQRGMSEETIKKFKLSAAANHVFFPLFSIEKNNLVLRSAIRYSNFYGKKAQRFLGPRGDSFSLLVPRNHSFLPLLKKGQPLPGGQTILLFESPIDALSYWQLHPYLSQEKNLLLLSTCGSPASSFFSRFAELLLFLGCKKAKFLFDNDDFGRFLTRKLMGSVPKETEVAMLPSPLREKTGTSFFVLGRKNH